MYSVSLVQSSLVSVSSKRAKREMRSTPARRKLDAQQHPRGRRLSRSFDYHSVPGQHVSLFSFEKATILQTLLFRLHFGGALSMSFSSFTSGESVDGSPVCKRKVTFSNENGYLLTRPQGKVSERGSPLSLDVVYNLYMLFTCGVHIMYMWVISGKITGTIFYLSDDVDGNPAHYTEIQVNQLSDASDGFLPPLHTTGMYSMVHSWENSTLFSKNSKLSLKYYQCFI